MKIGDRDRDIVTWVWMWNGYGYAIFSAPARAVIGCRRGIRRPPSCLPVPSVKYVAACLKVRVEGGRW